MGYSSKDKKPFEELGLIADAETTVEDFLAHSENSVFKDITEKTKRFLSGFYSPFGLELLSTIDFVIQDKHVATRDEITRELENWSERKKTLFTNHKFIDIALKNIQLHLPQPQ